MNIPVQASPVYRDYSQISKSKFSAVQPSQIAVFLDRNDVANINRCARCIFRQHDKTGLNQEQIEARGLCKRECRPPSSRRSIFSRIKNRIF